MGQYQDRETGTTAVADAGTRRTGEPGHSAVIDRLDHAVRSRIELLRPLCGPHLTVFAHARHILERYSANGSAGIILCDGKLVLPAGRAFHLLADSLACLAYRKGGVKFLGLHFDPRRQP